MKINLIFFLSILLFLSCQKDDSLVPTPSIVDGQFVRLDITNKVLNLDKPDDFTFGGTLTAPGNNVKRYELFVRRTTNDNVVTRPYVKLPIDISTFPYELKVTPQNIADALGVSLSSLKVNDTYNFLGYSYNESGKKCDYNSLSTTVKTQIGLKQGYKFKTTIVSDTNFTVANQTFDNYN